MYFPKEGAPESLYEASFAYFIIVCLAGVALYYLLNNDNKGDL